MSGNLCPCQFNWPSDTHGFKRDTISSEKAWLDFAVRHLSREAAGKGNGQETVWSVQCKPSWWDPTGLPWKNPTTNPKDNKDILIKKYEVLEHHLKKENRFPSDLEEEAKLWANKKYKELFLLCDLTCLLRKVSGVHSAIKEACKKSTIMNAQINQSVLESIRSCLSSTLKETENFKKGEPSKQLKRSHNDGKENPKTISCKKLKLFNENKKHIVPILPKPDTPISLGTTCPKKFVLNVKYATNQEDIFQYANSILQNRKRRKTNGMKSHPISGINSMVCQENFNPSKNSEINQVSDHSDSLPSSSTFSLECFKSMSNDMTDFPPIETFKLSENSNNQIDFFLSPNENKPITNGFYFDRNNENMPNTSPFINDNKTNPLENEPSLEVTSLPSDHQVYPSSSSNNSGSVRLNNEWNSEIDELSFGLDINDLSPSSTVSEPHSCPSGSDGGYISAEDLNLEFNELVSGDVEQLVERGSDSLGRFLFENTDSDYHLWDEIMNS